MGSLAGGSSVVGKGLDPEGGVEEDMVLAGIPLGVGDYHYYAVDDPCRGQGERESANHPHSHLVLREPPGNRTLPHRTHSIPLRVIPNFHIRDS